MALKEESNGTFESLGIKPLYTGIGSQKATQKLTEALKRLKPAGVLNLGSAGSFRWPVGTLVEVSQVVHRDQSHALFTEALELRTKTKLPKAICGSADYVETDPEHQTEVMDMEAYALALVCKKFGIEFNSIKYITDGSEHKTVQDWKNNVQKCAVSLSRWFQAQSDFRGL